MDKRDIYFGEKGLTSTSANYIANAAREYVAAKMNFVESMSFVDRTVSRFGVADAKPVVMGRGLTEPELETVRLAYADIAKANALIAWLREGIKARDSFAREVKSMTLEAFCKAQDTEMPQPPKPADAMTDDDYYAALPLRDRVRYHTLEAKCGTLGDAIHNGRLDVARNEAMEAVNNPCTLADRNNDTLVTTTAPSMTQEVIDNFYFSIQNEHREAQSELNAIKFACEKAVQADVVAKATEHNAAVSAYNARLAELNSQMTLWCKKRMAEVSALKIIVPEALAPIFNTINELGKKK